MTDLQNIAREWADGQRKAAKLSADAEAHARRYVAEMGGAGCPQCPDWIARLDAERAKVKRLREALEFYEQIENYWPPDGAEESPIADDYGQRARAAIEDTDDA